jgi:hypothetical protein
MPVESVRGQLERDCTAKSHVGQDLVQNWHYSTVGIKITAGSLRWHPTASGMRVSRVSP